MPGYEGLGLPDTGGGLLGGLNQGLQGVAESIRKYREKKEQQDRDLATSDMIKSYATQRGLMSPENATKYEAASLNQKIGMTHGLVGTLSDDLKREIQSSKQENFLLRFNLAQEKMNQQPQIVPVQGADGKVMNFYKGERGWSLIPGQAGSKQATPDKAFDAELKRWKLTPDAFEDTKAWITRADGQIYYQRPDGSFATMNPQTFARIKALKSEAEVPAVEPALPTKAATGPAVGTKRTINGTPAEWDGTGWVAAQ